MVADIVNRKDIGVIQRGDRARFSFEAAHAVSVTRERNRKQLDGNATPQPAVTRTIDFSHSTRSERGKNFVRPDLCARCEGHVARNYRPNLADCSFTIVVSFRMSSMHSSRRG